MKRKPTIRKKLDGAKSPEPIATTAEEAVTSVAAPTPAAYPLCTTALPTYRTLPKLKI